MKKGTRIVLGAAIISLIFLFVGSRLPDGAWIFVTDFLCGIGTSFPAGIGVIIGIDLWRWWQARQQNFNRPS